MNGYFHGLTKAEVYNSSKRKDEIEDMAWFENENGGLVLVEPKDIIFTDRNCTDAEDLTVFDQITQSPEKLTEYIARMFELNEHERRGFRTAINVRTVL